MRPLGEEKPRPICSKCGATVTGENRKMWLHLEDVYYIVIVCPNCGIIWEEDI